MINPDLIKAFIDNNIYDYSDLDHYFEDVIKDEISLLQDMQELITDAIWREDLTDYEIDRLATLRRLFNVELLHMIQRAQGEV